MSRVEYYVMMTHGAWMINFFGEFHGPYENCETAIGAAVYAANQAGSNGHNARVLVEAGENNFRVEWTYGEDPYPPTALESSD